MTSYKPPPSAPRKPHSFTHHGVTVDDPYAWLRDPNYPQVDDPEILQYLEAENACFESYFAPLGNLVQTLFDELKARQPAQDASVPFAKNGYWYKWAYEQDAQYRTWYRAPVDAPDSWQVLLDEGQLAEGEKYFSLGALDVSPDGTKLAYSTDTQGGERYTLHTVDIESRRALLPPIIDTTDGVVWNSTSTEFLYTVLNEHWQPLQIKRRRLSEPQSDVTVYHEGDASFRVGLSLSQSEQYVFIVAGTHTQTEVYCLPRADLAAAPRLLAGRRPDFEYHVDHRPGHFLIRSNLRHQNFDIFIAPESSADPENWQLLVEGDQQQYLTGHLALANHLIIEQRTAGLDQIRVLELSAQGAINNEHFVAFPEQAYAVGLQTNPNFDTHTVRLAYTSMVTPNTIYAYDTVDRTLTTLKVQQIPSGYDPGQFVTARLQADARDGVQVPISLVHHRDTPLDGSAPLYLYGYGAYGHGLDPSFSSTRISLLERGFIFALAHIRGGDELGYHWYTQGKLEARNNTFNDFIDVARHLIALGIAQAGKIAIAGGSAGGELMGAVVNQAPELWGAVAAHVPFVDVLNTMLDETLPLTPIEWSEWGNPIEDEGAFAAIRSYSPYDQLKPGDYPPMLVTAGLNDPRVTYWEPAKYVAKLRAMKTDSNPLLLKTNMGAGHRGQSGRFDALREIAEEYAFFISLLGES